MKKILCSATLLALFAINTTNAETNLDKINEMVTNAICSNPPTLKVDIAKQYAEIESKDCHEQSQFWRVRQDNKMALIDNTGKVIIPFKYNYISNDISHHGQLNEYFVVSNNGDDFYPKWGIIDKTGKEVFALQNGFIYPISQNLFRIEVYDKEKMDKLSKPYFGANDSFEDIISGEKTFEFHKIIGTHRIAQELNAKVGILGNIDGTLKLLLPIEYDYVIDDDEFFTIYKDSKGLMIDKKGEILKSTQ